MDSELDRTHPLDGEWDEQTRREWEQFLDSRDEGDEGEEAYAAWVAEMNERRLLNRLDLEREEGERF